MMDTDKEVLLIYNSKEKNDIFKIETNDKEGIDKIAVLMYITRINLNKNCIYKFKVI